MALPLFELNYFLLTMLRTTLQAFRGGAVASEAELLEDGGAGGGGGGANIDMPDHLLGGDLNILSLDVLGAGAGAGGLE